eukprot:GHVP01011446.1.p1 GENE.GHVP01011446.1~~GHVP01011446.1.p1  ORF type:complete len:147 (-),score=28.13 GHVP01011446.1:731-1171(-)
MEISISLLGKNFESDDVKNFMKEAFDSWDKTDFPDSVFYTSKQKGLSLCFDKTEKNSAVSILGAIHVFNDIHFKGFKKCPYKLPLGVSIEWEAWSIVNAFGEPCKKSGGKCPITLVYDKLGVQFDLQSSNWDDRRNKICSVTFLSL